MFRFKDQVGSCGTRRRRGDGSSSKTTVRRFALYRCPRRGAFDHQSCHELVTTHAIGVRVSWHLGRVWSVDRCALIVLWYVSALCIRVPVLSRTSLLLPGHACRDPERLPVYSVAPAEGRTPSIDQRLHPLFRLVFFSLSRFRSFALFVFFMVLHTATVIRKCSLCRLTGHRINRCPSIRQEASPVAARSGLAGPPSRCARCATWPATSQIFLVS